MPKSRKQKRQPQSKSPLATGSPKRFSERVDDAYRRLSTADAARKTGRNAEAIKILEPLVDEYPDYVAALHILGLVHLARRSSWPALSCFVRASMLNPKDWTILTSLAQTYLSLGANEMAIQILEQARQIEENKADIHYTLGLIYDREREYEQAVQAFQKAVDLDPGHANAALALGLASVHLGELEKAAAAFELSHRSEPASIGPIAASAQLPAGLARFDVGEALGKAKRRPEESDEEHRVRAAFAEAHLLHRKGDYAAAWAKLDTANSTIQRRIEKELVIHRQKREIFLEMARAQADLDEPAAANDSRYPVSLFILGISRSGKTTAERALASYPAVRRGYENPIVELAVQRASQGAGLLTMRQLGDLPSALGRSFKEHYLDELQGRAGNAAVFTSTHPGRIGDVGKLSRLIPNSRFVFVDRNREDTALRIYMKHFREGGNFYAYAMEEILAEIEWYAQMNAIWRSTKSVISTDISYEELVTNPATTMEKIFQLCGISDKSGNQRPAIGDDRGCSAAYVQWFPAG